MKRPTSSFLPWIFGVLGLLAFVLAETKAQVQKAPMQPVVFVEADNAAIQYTGRIDFSDPKKPRFWSSGVYIKARFQGTFCEVVLNDEELWNTSHNYIQVAIDDQPPFKIQTRGKKNTFRVAQGLSDGPHTITLCKNTEAGIGYLEFVGLRCAGLLPLPPKPTTKLEFYGDSITCGMGSDLVPLPCGEGQWYDQHNAYLSYGPTTARLLNAQWQLTSVSGIGLAHSCCDMKVTMPDVWDKTNLRENTLPWDFEKYQPDAVMVCLGQNDGAQNAEQFRKTYLKFIGKLRKVYPQANIVCLTSPMADQNLTTFLQENLRQIVAQANVSGDRKIYKYFFSQQFNSGCGAHPDVSDHQLMANELAAFLKTILR